VMKKCKDESGSVIWVVYAWAEKIYIILFPIKIILDESGSVIWVVLHNPIGKICSLSNIMHFLTWSVSAQCMIVHCLSRNRKFCKDYLNFRILIALDALGP
jgi:hypothetical protein